MRREGLLEKKKIGYHS